MDIVSSGKIQNGDGTGIGLQSMKERAESIGATIDTQVKDDTFTVSLDFNE
ncbi:MAG: GHKL domain-containing protein [Bacteroidales bacterium]|nr:GHKL domain-containing protein [Bacteroidales bacterium]